MDDFIRYPTGKIEKGSWCDHCKTYNSRHIACSVVGTKDGEVMMVKRAIEPYLGYWCLPGGYLFWDEDAKDCAKREFEEETGHSIKNLSFFGIYSDPKRDARQNVDLTFSGVVGKKINDPDDETSCVRLFDFDNLPEKIAADHRKIIKDYELSTRGT